MLTKATVLNITTKKILGYGTKFMRKYCRLQQTKITALAHGMGQTFCGSGHHVKALHIIW